MMAMNKQPPTTMLQRTKTLYTPVFYSPEHSLSSSISTPMTFSAKPTSKTPSAYLDYLSRTHVALAQIVKEVPPSRHGSPMTEGEEEDVYVDVDSEARVEALRERVRDGFEVAGGEPADGKWGLLVQLLRTGCTRGRYRWMRTRADGEAAKSGSGWVLANTEAEWFELEKRMEEEERVTRKVESWKRKVDIDVGLAVDVNADGPKALSVSEDSDGTKVDDGSGKGKAKRSTVVGPGLVQLKAQPATKTNAHDPMDPSPLGFAVVKRSSANVGNKASGKYKPTNDVANDPSKPKSNSDPKSRPSDVSDENVEVIAHENMSEHPIRVLEKEIADISETFLPPSFPSQLSTSTPNPRPNPNPVREKPPPIPVLASSPLSSPQSIRVYGRPNAIVNNTSASLPTVPAHPQNPDTVESRKRPLSVTPERVLKRARTMPSPLTGPLPDPASISSDPLPQSAPPPSTPTNGNDKRNHSPSPITPKRPGQLPTLTELLASAKKSKMSPKGKGRKISGDKAVVADGVDGKAKARLPFTKEEPQCRPEDAYAMNTDIGDASPTKSLSSLAGSDSDSDSQPGSPFMPSFTHDAEESFNPICSSTQMPFGVARDGMLGTGSIGGGSVGTGTGTGTGTGFGRTSSGFGFGMGYNSQFDVEGEVDRVSELLERDVDFGGWLRDVSVEAEEDEVAAGLGESP